MNPRGWTLRRTARILGALALTALGIVVPATAQTYQWAKGIGGNAVSLDVLGTTGDVYVTGNFYGTADFDPGAGTANLTSVGDPDVYVAKYNSAGAYAWAFRLGGSGFDYAMSVKADASGNVYVLGYFTGTVDFDPGAGTVNLTASSPSNGFLAKYSSTGTLVWARAFTGTGQTNPQRMALDPSGNVVIAGVFIGTIDFDPGAATLNLTSSANHNLFFAKYNSSGNVIFAANVDATNSILYPNLAVDGSGNLYVSALFSGTLDADPSAAVVSLSGPSAANLLLAKYSSTGTHLWSRAIVGAENGLLSNCLAVDASGVYVTGAVTTSTDFGGTILGSLGSQDVFLAKYSTANTLLWVKGMGGTGYDMGGALALDGTGAVYVGGQFSASGDFDPGAGTRTLTSAGNTDLFFGKYTSAGAYVWAYGLGLPGYDYLTGVLTDSAANFYINGLLSPGTVDFDLGPGTANLSSPGYFAKYSQASSGCVTPPSGMVAWLPLDEASGTLADNRLSASDGTASGTVAGVAGKVSLARDFDGIDDYVSVPDHAAIDFGTGDFSIDAWINTTASSGVIVGKRVTSGYVGYIFMVSGSRLLLQMADPASSWYNFYPTSGVTVNDGAWHLVAVTVDRDSTTGGKFYVDGTLVYTFNPMGRSGDLSNSAVLEIGRVNGASFFDGLIDELELFNRVLTPTEISSIFNAGAAGKCK